MKARKFLRSDSAVATGLGMEFLGLLLTFGTVAPVIGVGLFVAGVLLLAANLMAGGDQK